MLVEMSTQTHTKPLQINKKYTEMQGLFSILERLCLTLNSKEKCGNSIEIPSFAYRRFIISFYRFATIYYAKEAVYPSEL